MCIQTFRRRSAGLHQAMGSNGCVSPYVARWAAGIGEFRSSPCSWLHQFPQRSAVLPISYTEHAVEPIAWWRPAVRGRNVERNRATNGVSKFYFYWHWRCFERCVVETLVRWRGLTHKRHCTWHAIRSKLKDTTWYTKLHINSETSAKLAIL